MASMMTHDLRHRARERVEVCGSFAPAGTDAPTAVQGKGFSVAFTSTGTWTITFSEVYKQLDAFTVTLQMASATNLALQCGAWTNASKTMVVRAHAAGTVTDIAANANNRIHFRATFANTRVHA